MKAQALRKQLQIGGRGGTHNLKKKKYIFFFLFFFFGGGGIFVQIIGGARPLRAPPIPTALKHR